MNLEAKGKEGKGKEGIVMIRILSIQYFRLKESNGTPRSPISSPFKYCQSKKTKTIHSPQLEPTQGSNPQPSII